MPETYALIQDGKVISCIVWDGPEVAPMEFAKGVTYAAVPDGEGNQPSIGWIFDGKSFIAPAPTDEQINEQKEHKIANNIAMKSSLIALATEAIAPLQDAVELDDANNQETASLKEWKQYRVAVNRIDANTSEDILWPAMP